LVAQLGCSYEYIYQDSVGYARLRRAQVICETLEVCPHAKWNRFLQSVGLHLPIEFNEGDVGLSGGIQILEEGSLHPVTTDTITRYGGSCAPELPWPEDTTVQQDGEDDRFDRMEAAIQKTLKKLSGEKSSTGGSAGGTGESLDEEDQHRSNKNSYLSEQEEEDEKKKQDALDAGMRRQSSMNSLDGQELSVVMQAAAAAAEADEDQQDGEVINIDSFDELVVSAQQAREIQGAWAAFVNSAGSREKAGEALYNTLADGAPMLSSMFHNQPAIQAMKLMGGFNSFITEIDNPGHLKAIVETLGFGHMGFQIDVNDVECVRDAIIDLLFLELGDKFTRPARVGWRRILNYIGGAIIYIKQHYAERLHLLSESWALCNGSKDEKETGLEDEEEGGEPAHHEKHTSDADNSKTKKGESNIGIQNIPTTFKEMFKFNAAVMGMSDGTSWMDEVLEQFSDIVTNISDSTRTLQECDLLCMRISKRLERESRSMKSVNLPQFKSCMLAALRSLLPKVWSTAHEVAWDWLWQSVERHLNNSLHRPLVYEKSLGELLEGIDEETGFQVRKDFYTKIF
jgi:hemoglobin-like flavoprotein